MTKVGVTFGDPESLEIDYLTSAFAGRAEQYKAATVTPNFPATALTTTTHVQVELEAGGAADYPIAERAQVRFTCYAPPGKRTWAKGLASLTQGLVFSQPSGGGVQGVRMLIGRSDVVTDPDTKNLMVWFLAEITLAPTALAS